MDLERAAGASHVLGVGDRHRRVVVPATGGKGDVREALFEQQPGRRRWRSEEHTSELQSQSNLVCRLLLEKKKQLNQQTEPDSRAAASVPCPFTCHDIP